MATNDALRALLDEPIGIAHKAFPTELATVPLGEIGARGLRLDAGDLLLPALVLREEPLAHNIRLMADWCAARGVSLAPHGKTTMAPQLFQRQLDAGAWAITAASVSQARVMHAYGVRRVLIANEVTDVAGARWIAETTNDDPSFELLCLVDSIDGVTLLDDALVAAGARRELPVLIELGTAGRRAGVRADEDARAVAAAVAASAQLRVGGVECFEGVAGPGLGPEVMAEVDELLERVRHLAEWLDASGQLGGNDELLLTAGGSVFFDRVAELLPRVRLDRPTRVVVRSGCYVTHDSIGYEQYSPLGGVRGAAEAERLRPALELWSAVLSRPEHDLAILGFGKRDAPFDAGLPTPLRALAPDGEPRDLGEGAEVFSLHDQHAYARLGGDARLDVGDRVVLGISHPCTAFDKWSLLPVVDRDDRVIDAVRTLF